MPEGERLTCSHARCVCRLHAKLKEEDEAAKLYNRFVALAESSEVSV